MARSEFSRASVTAAIGASVGMFVGTTPMVSAIASLFIAPISEEFGISRTDYSILMLVSPWIVALCAPFGGRLLDRHGTRKIVLPVVLVFGFAQLAMWGAHSLWAIIALFAVIGVCGGVHTYNSYTRVVSMWFAKHRGIMMGLMIAFGSALGAVLIPQLVGHLIQNYSWRAGYVGMGCIILLYGLPVLYFFLREPVGSNEVSRQQMGSAQPAVELVGLTWKETMRTRTFWTIFLALFLGPFAIIGTVGQAFPMLTERGFSPQTALNAISSLYIGGMTGQLTSGFLLDRINTPRIAIPFFAVSLVGMAILHTTTDASLLLPSAMLIGVAQGSELGIGAYLISRFFGLKAYGAIYSTIFAGANVALGIGLITMGNVHDRFGSYAPMAYVMPTALLLVIGLLLTLPGYKYARQSAVSP
jgi:MFS family permease